MPWRRSTWQWSQPLHFVSSPSNAPAMALCALSYRPPWTGGL